MSNQAILQAHQITKRYAGVGAGTHALAGVNLSLHPGESVAIMGPSGSGKTTLLHCLAGVIAPTSGQVMYQNMVLDSMPDAARTALRRTDFGFVFQQGQLLPELPAAENAALPLMLAGVPLKAAVAQASQWLTYLGLGGMEDRRPGELSGGQAQRVAIARALATGAKVIFADEPTGALDQATGAEVLTVLTTATAQTGAALVVVTHDPGVAAHCSRTIHMQDGRIIGEHHRDGAAPTHAAHPNTMPAHTVHGTGEGLR